MPKESILDFFLTYTLRINTHFAMKQEEAPVPEKAGVLVILSSGLVASNYDDLSDPDTRAELAD